MCSGRPGIPGPAAPARMWFDFMLTRQNYRATPQFLDTEQLRAQQLRIKVITQGIPCVCPETISSSMPLNFPLIQQGASGVTLVR